MCSGVIWYQWVWHGFSGCGMISSGLAWPQWVWDINSGLVDVALPLQVWHGPNGCV